MDTTHLHISIHNHLLLSFAKNWPLFLHLLPVLSLVWFAGFCHFSFLLSLAASLMYLHSIHRSQKRRLKARLQRRFEEEKIRRATSTDSETVKWFNSLLQTSWPSIEPSISDFLASRLQQSLDGSKLPRILHRLVVERLRLGDSPPAIHSIRLLRGLQLQDGSDAATMEMDVSFVAANNMIIKLLASLNFGLAGKLYGDNMAISGKLRVGLRFVPFYPYLGLMSIAFVSVPKFGIDVRPLSSNNLAVTDLPVVASWVSKTAQASVETWLVEPFPLRFDFLQMLDMQGHSLKEDYILKSIAAESAFQSKEAPFAVLEIIAGKDLEAKDLSGFSDPYVIIRLNKLKLRKTSVKNQTLNPIWNELFKIDISSWNLPANMCLQVRDRDFFGKDDELGWCEFDLKIFRDGRRHEIWAKLKDIKRGQLLIAITIVDPKPTISFSKAHDSSIQASGLLCTDDEVYITQKKSSPATELRALRRGTSIALLKNSTDKEEHGAAVWNNALPGGSSSVEISRERSKHMPIVRTSVLNQVSQRRFRRNLSGSIFFIPKDETLSAGKGLAISERKAILKSALSNFTSD